MVKEEKSTPKETTHLEIEREFLIPYLPSQLQSYSHVELLQGYLHISPNPAGMEFRVRKEGDNYFSTIKRSAGSERFETNTPIIKRDFDDLWDITEGRRIEKTRYRIPYGNLTIELDIYHENLDGLITAEVEFETIEDKNRFVAPDWFGKEVTEDERYKDKNLSRFGKPPES